MTATAATTATLPTDDTWTVGGKTFHSRLIVGSGKYTDFEETARATEASGAEMITVAVRRVNITETDKDNLLDYLDKTKLTVLPNTAGCFTAEDAIRTARLAREALASPFIKLEVIGDDKTLFPDNIGTLEATETLAKEGFVVMAYTTDDPVMCKKLENAGAAAVMPLGAPIGSGLGLRNPYNIKIILEFATVPVIVDAGVGTPSDATLCMELGCTAVLMNTGIAGAKEPVLMAEAMRDAVAAGRKGYMAGRIPKKLYATASSPITGLIE